MTACQIEAGIAQDPINDSAWTMDIKEHIDTSLQEHVDTRSVDVRRSLPFGQSTPKYLGHIYTFHRISLNFIRFILTRTGEFKKKILVVHGTGATRGEPTHGLRSCGHVDDEPVLSEAKPRGLGLVG